MALRRRLQSVLAARRATQGNLKQERENSPRARFRAVHRGARRSGAPTRPRSAMELDRSVERRQQLSTAVARADVRLEPTTRRPRVQGESRHVSSRRGASASARCGSRTELLEPTARTGREARSATSTLSAVAGSPPAPLLYLYLCVPRRPQRARHIAGAEERHRSAPPSSPQPARGRPGGLRGPRAARSVLG